MFFSHYVCSFEIFVKILNIRLFISTIVILAFSIIVVILIVLTIHSLDRFIWENIIFNEHDTCMNKTTCLILSS